LIGSVLGTLAAGDTLRQTHLAMAAAVLTGLLAILAWALRLGNIANFVSETILTGFKVGAGLVIASTQLPKLFGVSSGGNNFLTRILDLARHLKETNLPTLLVGLGALTLLIAGERLLPGRPIALFVVLTSIVVMTFLPLASLGVKTVGTIPEGLPRLGWPMMHWSDVDNLLVVSMACFLLSYVESISVVRTFALKHDHSISADQELLALGAANLVAGVGQGYPVAGGMSQSAVNEKAGAQSPLALVFASASLGAVLLFLTGLMRNLPQPVLAAVVLIAVGGLIKPSELRHLNQVSRMEFRVAMVATVGVLFFGILKGVLLAAVFSLLVLLKRASRPRIAVLGRLEGSDRFVDMSRNPGSKQVPGTLVVRIESGLFYFNAENVHSEILDHVRRRGAVNLVIIDLSTSPNIDLGGARMLGQLHEKLTKSGVLLKLAEVHGSARDLLQAEGLHTRIFGIEQRLQTAALLHKREQVSRAS
jgi:SulP family sulfate permease